MSADPPKKRRFTGRAVGSASASTTTSTSTPTSTAATNPNAVPASILEDPLINAAIDALLPKNYGFEVHKSIHQIRRWNIQRVALQMPEGLSMYACALTDLIERFTDAEAVILADVTYGACCVDDYTARALGCDMLIHYGHSCLIPIDTTSIRCLYVFVEIGVDTAHLRETVRLNFPACLPSTSREPRGSKPAAPSRRSAGPGDGGPALEVGFEEPQDEPSAGGKGGREEEDEIEECHLAVVGTVQFLSAVHGLKAELEALPPSLPPSLPLLLSSSSSASIGNVPLQSKPKKIRYRLTIPQIHPLSPGEILGCTAPRLSPTSGIQGLLYVGDGRFHLESVMVANPWLRDATFRYDPYEKRVTREGYGHEEMRKWRAESVNRARETLRHKPASQPDASGDGTAQQDTARNGHNDQSWAVILGTLGRQGSLSVLSTLLARLPLQSTIPILLSELSPTKLALFRQVEVFVQTSCPRLSIDWGYAFEKPLLSSYEASVALGRVKESWTAAVSPATRPPIANAAAPVIGSGEQEEGLADADGGDYPMDFYADFSKGPWTPRYHVGIREKERKARMAERAREREAKKAREMLGAQSASAIPIAGAA